MIEHCPICNREHEVGDPSATMRLPGGLAFPVRECPNLPRGTFAVGPDAVDGTYSFSRLHDEHDEPPEVQRTHTFSAEVTGKWDGLGDIDPVITCHNDPDDVNRDCKFTESEPVNDCPEYAEWFEQVSDPERDVHWDERPGMACGGWEFDGGHFHPDSGCGVLWTIRYVEREVVSPTGTLRAGDGFTVTWQEGCPLLHPIEDDVSLPILD